MLRNALLIIALLNASALFSATNSGTSFTSTGKATGYPVEKIRVSHWDRLQYTMRTETITSGSTQKQVLRLLGEPSQVLGPNTVLYNNCEPDQAQARHCKDLIITFDEGKVQSLTFGNAPMTQLIASNEARKALQNQEPGSAMAMSLPDE